MVVQWYDSGEAQQCAFLPWCLPCHKWFASFLCITHAQSALAKFVDIESWQASCHAAYIDGTAEGSVQSEENDTELQPTFQVCLGSILMHQS